jgi:hypothetical protein
MMASGDTRAQQYHSRKANLVLSHPIVKYGLKFILAMLATCAIGMVLILIDGIWDKGQFVDGSYQPSVLSMTAARIIGGSPIIAFIWVWWRSTRTPKPSYTMDES